MTTQSTTPATAATATGRWPATAVFFLNGLAVSTFIVQLPALKQPLGLTDGELGMTGMTFAAAALVSMQFVGGLVARVGSRPVLRSVLAAQPAVLACVGLVDSMAGLLLVSIAFGLVNGAMDASMNAHAIAAERLAGRAILNGCHAAWSISAVLASLTAAALIHVTVPLPLRVGLVAAAVFAGGLLTGPRLLPPTVDSRSSARAARAWRDGWSRPVVGLGLVGLALMVCEGAALGWGAVFLHDAKAASLSLATTAVTAFAAGQTAGRLVGDRLTDRFGAGPVFRVGGVIAATGLTLAVLAPHPIASIAGFAVTGIGGSVMLPLTFSAVGHLGHAGGGTALAVSRLTTFTYAGVLAGPGLVGFAAQGVGLGATMAGLVPVLLAVAILTRLPRRPAFL